MADETSRASLEAAVEMERRRLGDLVANVRGVFWEAWRTPDGAMQRVDFVNPQLEALLGYSREEWLATPNFWLAIVHPEDRDRAGREAEAIFESGKGGTSRFRWVARSGRTIWVETQSIVSLDRNGRPTGMRGITMDVTDRVDAEQRFQRQLTFTQAIAESLAEGLYAVDTDGRLTFLNPAGEEMLGLVASGTLGKPIHDLIHRAHAPGGDLAPGAASGTPPDCPLLSVAATGAALRDHEDWFTRGDGTAFPVLCSAAPIVVAGNVTGAAVTFQDVSARRRTEQRRSMRLRMSQILAESFSLQTSAGRLLRTFCEGLGFDAGALWLVDRPARTIRAAEIWHPPGMDLGEFRVATLESSFPVGVGLPGRVWASGRPDWIPDVSRDGNFPRASFAARAGLTGAFGAPISFGPEILGVVEFWGHTVREPDDELLDLMGAIGSQIGLFIERKRAEEAVRHSEARKAAILESAMDAIVTMDAGGRILEMNPAAESTFGYGRDQAVGLGIEALFPPERRKEPRPGAIDRFRPAQADAMVGRRLELVAVRSDGAEFPVEVSLTRIASDGPVLYTGYIRDLTEKRRAESYEAARTRQTALGADIGLALAEAEDVGGILARSARAVVERLDGALARIWMLESRESLLELRASAGVDDRLEGPHVRVPLGQGRIGRIARDRMPETTSVLAEDSDSAERAWAEREGLASFAGVPLAVEDRVIGVLGLFSRGTLPFDTLEALGSVAPLLAQAIERKRVEGEIVHANQQLKTLLYVVSHDLKEPLRAIESFSGILESRYMAALEESGQDLVRRIVRGGGRLRRILDDILLLSRVRQMGTPKDEVPGEVLVREALQRLEHKVMESKAVVTVERPLPFFRADKTWATQAIYNLVANALKFTRAGVPPEVSVRAWHGEDGSAEAGIVVADRGPGVDPQHSARIFELFQRAVGREVEGTGAGLAIVSEVAVRHGGRAFVRAREGGGSEFVLTLGAPASSE